MYLVDEDVTRLCAMLDEDPEIALVRADGKGRWKAQRHVPKLRAGSYVFWHIPSGPIELESTKLKARPRIVKNPFAGWREIVTPFEPGVPWFGPGPLGIIRLQLRGWMSADRGRKGVGHSSFSWIGHEYRSIGYPAPAATEAWWKSLRKRVGKIATAISSSGAIGSSPKDMFAFADALAAIRKGARRVNDP